MENPRFEKEEIIKNIRNIVTLENEQNDTVIKDIEHRNIKNLFEYEKQEEIIINQ